MRATKMCDVTAYARRLGYTGEKPVIVQNGKVISHRNQCWFDFCEKLKSASIKDEY